MIATNTDPFIGLCELKNIATIVVDDWDSKLNAANDLINGYLDETDKNVILAAKDVTTQKKLKKLFLNPRIKSANMINDVVAFRDLSDIYAIVVVESSDMSDYTKYLLALQAKAAQCRLAFIA